MPPLNFPSLRRDQGQAASQSWGYIGMESIRPDKTDPIPLRQSPPGLGSIMIRFVGLLVVAVVVLALVWSR
jgi:hypothetical protein